MMKNCQVLIVDDDLTICESIQEFLGMFGCDAFTAYSAEEAIGILRSETIQVVITDIRLPGMDGLEFTDLVKREFDADVIVMTGYSGDYSYEGAISKGASDFVFKPVRFEELLLRTRRVFKERELEIERSGMLEKLQKLAITDGLTGLYNSRHFYTQLGAEIDRADRYGHPLSLLLMDIDYFKCYNDNYGHLEGDKVLLELGRIILSCLRKIDSAYRYGGEEFTVILPETGGEEAEKVAQRIRREVEDMVFCPKDNANIKITISVGVTRYLPGEEISQFVQRADIAMYTSKQNGRNSVSCFFDEK